MSGEGISIEICGPSVPLCGHVLLPGSKNAALPMLALAATSPATVHLHAVPRIVDVHVLLEILEHLGCAVGRHDDQVTIRHTRLRDTRVPTILSSRLRGSIYALPLLAARVGKGHLGRIGGDVLARTLAPHARAFRAFGFEFRSAEGGLEVGGGPLRAAEFVLDDRGNTATGVAIILAAAADGRSIIHNASLEPENDDLLEFATKLGATSRREGRTLIVDGPMPEREVVHAVPADRIFCGTVLAASAITGGTVRFPRSILPRIVAVTEALQAAGIRMRLEDTDCIVEGRPREGFRVRASMYPGFPTDLLPQFSAIAASIIDEKSQFTDAVYGNRFAHMDSFIRLGAKVRMDGEVLVVAGSGGLRGAVVQGAGIRETAAMMILALVANGKTLIRGAGAVSRAYEDLPATLRTLGAETFEG